MPNLLLKYNPKILQSKPPIVIPELRQLLLASFAAQDVEILLQATGKVVSLVKDKVFTAAMHENSPALKGFQWQGYLEASTVRLAYFLAALRRYVPKGGKVFDFGSYFGNFSLTAQEAGYTVTAIDFYKYYGVNFAEVVSLLNDSGVRVVETESFAEKNSADAVLSMGVIEHIPHTPRQVLQQSIAMLRPGGLLFLETPNLAYYHKRQTLLQGQSIFPDIRGQYYTKEPFAGHHREFTLEEVLWMLQEEGMKVEHQELFNMSYLSNPCLTQDNIELLRAGCEDTLQREIIFIVARKSN